MARQAGRGNGSKGKGRASMRGRLAPSVQLRIGFGDSERLGPGKIALLERIESSGSIAAAGRDLGMSYRRAWLLADALNTMFREAVFVAAPGGARGGGATLTDFGRSLVAAYRRTEERTQRAVDKAFAQFAPKPDR